MESTLSQLYGMYENYWHAILWCNFELIEENKDKKVFIIKQPIDKYEVGSAVSQIRKSRLEAQSAAIGMNPKIQVLFEKDKYLSIEKTENKRKILTLSVKNATNEIKFINANWQAKSVFLQDFFPEEILTRISDRGFSIKEVLEVVRNLVILSAIISNRYPDNDSAFNIKKLLAFCPKINKTDLQTSLYKSTGFKFDKIKNILSFLEYKAFEKEDLWCHPIFSISDRHYVLLTSALITPVITRLVEHWLVSLKIELTTKGLSFERFVLDKLNSSINSNKLIKDFDKAVSKKLNIKIGKKEEKEEIDLLLRIGNVILIGESKSIVTTDSPISNYRTVETLKFAAAQVKRKTVFVQNNLPSVFEKLKWKYNPNEKYSFVNCIINSGRMYAGFEIDGIAVCDDKILHRYFTESEIPLASYFDDINHDAKHLAWVKLYSDFDELKKNLVFYLKSPPQVFENEKHFEYKEIRLPYLSENSYKMIFSRLVPKDLSISDRVDIESPFTIIKSRNYVEKSKNIDFIV